MHRAPVVLQVVRELILKLIPPDRCSTRTISEWVARLDHKLRNDAVEDDPLEVSTPGVADEVLDCLWCLLREEPYMDVAERGVDGGSIRNRRRSALRGCCR